MEPQAFSNYFKHCIYSYRYTAHIEKNMTSSTKPEVHNVSQRRRRRTEPEIDIMADRHTHTHTHRRTHHNTS